MRLLAALAFVPLLTACGGCPDPFELSERVVLGAGEAITLIAPDGELRVGGRERSMVLELQAHGCRANGDERVTLDSTDATRVVRVLARHADVRVVVPAGTALSLTHGSGDVEIRGVGPTSLSKRGGDTRITQVIGGATIYAGPGALYVRDVLGDVELTDGPGAAFVEGIDGAVRISDGSGGIYLRQIEGGVLIERDGSGAIEARTVRGDFEVRAKAADLRLIRYDDVKGEVVLPD